MMIALEVVLKFVLTVGDVYGGHALVAITAKKLTMVNQKVLHS